MNEENELDRRISIGIKEGPADCIRISEVATAPKKMKRHKAPGLSGSVAERRYWKSVDIGFMSWYCEKRMYSGGSDVKCGITN